MFGGSVYHHLPDVPIIFQVVMCEGCRFASHKTHSFDFVTNLVAGERARLSEVSKRFASLVRELQRRQDLLNHASKTCSQSAQNAELSVKQVIDQLRTALDTIRAAVSEKEQELIADIRRIQQVRRCLCALPWRVLNVMASGR